LQGTEHFLRAFDAKLFAPLFAVERRVRIADVLRRLEREALGGMERGEQR
jgi:hypothetical protein